MLDAKPIAEGLGKRRKPMLATEDSQGYVTATTAAACI